MNGHMHNRAIVGIIIINYNTGTKITHTKYRLGKTKNLSSVHTENEQNNKARPHANRHTKPGQQIATNRAMHNDMRLIENGEGEYDAVVIRGDKYSLIRGEYIPIGCNFHYPKVWGRKYAATKLLEYIMADKRKQIADAQRELDKLQRCLDKVNEWSDTDQ
jgi:hypothetical protein